MSPRDKLLDKLAKLKRHADSAEAIGNEAEAQAFATAFQRMLLDHKIDASDLELEEERRAEPVDRFPIDYSRYPDFVIKGQRTRWMEKLASVIAAAHFCRILVHPGSSRITLVGRKSEVAVAEYAVITLTRAAETIAKREHMKYVWEVYKSDRSTARARGFKAAFLEAFIARLAIRYDEEKRARSGATALVRFNDSTQAVNDFLNTKDERGRKRFGTSTALTRPRITSSEGVRRGRAAADAIDLHGRAVGTSSSVRGRLS